MGMYFSDRQKFKCDTCVYKGADSWCFGHGGTKVLFACEYPKTKLPSLAQLPNIDRRDDYYRIDSFKCKVYEEDKRPPEVKAVLEDFIDW